MARIAAFFASIALVIGGLAVAAELGGEQSGEPPSAKPPSTGAAAPASSGAAAADTGPPLVTPARMTASFAPPSERADIVDAIPEPPARSEAVIAAAAEAAAPVAYDPADHAPGWQQRKGEAALALIAYDWKRIGFRIKFMGVRPGYRAGTFPYEKLIEVYVRPDLSVEDIAWDIAHELGHAYDWVFNTSAERELYKQVRGYGDNPSWFACSGCTDFSTPAGDFAETFAFWAMDAARTHRGQITTPPTEQQLALLRPLFT